MPSTSKKVPYDPLEKKKCNFLSISEYTRREWKCDLCTPVLKILFRGGGGGGGEII